jgi:hypothetical protein
MVPDLGFLGMFRFATTEFWQLELVVVIQAVLLRVLIQWAESPSDVVEV